MKKPSTKIRQVKVTTPVAMWNWIGPCVAQHDIFGGRIGQDEGDQRRDAEHPVHDAARAITVGQHAAIGAEQARRDRIGRGQHAGGFDVELVDADQIARQPQRQRDEAAEGEEIIEREAPDLDVLQRLELEPGAARPLAFGAARQFDRVFAGGEPEHHRHDRDGRWPRLARSSASHRRPARRARRTWSPPRRHCRRRKCRAPCPASPPNTSATHRRCRPRRSRRQRRRQARRSGIGCRCGHRPAGRSRPRPPASPPCRRGARRFGRSRCRGRCGRSSR